MIFRIGGEDIYTYIMPNRKANTKLNQLIRKVRSTVLAILYTSIPSITSILPYFFYNLHPLYIDSFWDSLPVLRDNL